ncbi:MAG: hypothetical protein J6J43_09195 [Oscillospiraceae bacterium]|nr:hypothetical protein [Oscillospiraceae bacterium]
MKTILFQGDSITDCLRYREDPYHLGSGYAVITAGRIGVNFPGKYRFLNKGIGGNRSVDLYARVKCDIIALKPDILTILIGVNDTWHELAHQNGVSVERYEQLYDMLLCDVKAALPQTKIVLLEPFVLPGSGVEPYYDAFAQDVRNRQVVSKRLADKHGLSYVFLQKTLENFAQKTSNDNVLLDGVHPSPTGHALIADALYRVLEPIL